MFERLKSLKCLKLKIAAALFYQLVVFKELFLANDVETKDIANGTCDYSEAGS